MDKLVKGLIRDGHARVYLASTTDLCETARVRHGLWPTSAAALGRTLSVASIMGAMLKSDKEKLTIEINGGGAIGTIMADAFPHGYVRGFVGDPEILLINNKTGKLAVGEAVGKDGYLRVIRDISLKNDFTGTVRLISGEIGEDFAYYFTVSEQTPTAVSVGVFVEEDGQVSSAGALVVQMMPQATEEDIVYCEQIISHLPPISSLIKEGLNINALAKSIFEGIDILEEIPLEFHCGCKKERMYEALSTLNEEELLEMMREDHGCEIVCHYCNEHYQFNEEELNQLVLDKRNKNANKRCTAEE